MSIKRLLQQATVCNNWPAAFFQVHSGQNVSHTTTVVCPTVLQWKLSQTTSATLSNIRLPSPRNQRSNTTCYCNTHVWLNTMKKQNQSNQSTNSIHQLLNVIALNVQHKSLCSHPLPQAEHPKVVVITVKLMLKGASSTAKTENILKQSIKLVLWPMKAI